MLNWREIPFVRLLAVYLAGILLYFIYYFDSPILLMALSVLFAGLILVAIKMRGQFKYRWVFWFLPFLVFYSCSVIKSLIILTSGTPTIILVKK